MSAHDRPARVGLSVLGIGADTAKLTIDENRAVDVQLNAALARPPKASGVKHLAFMSAIDADVISANAKPLQMTE